MAARIARLATVDALGTPHLVPIVFAVDGDRVYSAVDAKPKRTPALRRLANIAVNPHAPTAPGGWSGRRPSTASTESRC
jgi:nitroimidazol reductase NimA-like FMN-containing flavoprotein (pyridoxamine 5'-phosphate oxidase superfamily)